MAKNKKKVVYEHSWKVRTTRNWVSRRYEGGDLRYIDGPIGTRYGIVSVDADAERISLTFVHRSRAHIIAFECDGFPTIRNLSILASRFAKRISEES